MSNEAKEDVARVHLHRPEIDTSEVDEKKLMQKIDWHVIPWLGVLYLLSFLDRGNVANAKVSLGCTGVRKESKFSVQLYNLEKDLHINDTQFAIALAVFFFPYAIFEVCRSQLSEKIIILAAYLLAREQCTSSSYTTFNLAIFFNACLGDCNDFTWSHT